MPARALGSLSVCFRKDVGFGPVSFQWLTHGKNRMYFLRHFRENNSAIFQTNLVS